MTRMGILAAIAVACLNGSALAEPITKPLTIAVLNDKSSVFSDAGGTGSVVAAQLAIDDVGGKVRGLPVKLLRPRSSEQDRYRRVAGARSLRSAGRRCDLRYRQFRDLAGGAEHGARARQGAGACWFGHRRGVRQAMRADRRDVALRHLFAGAGHRQGRGQAGRRHLVFHHGGLCVRHRHAGGSLESGAKLPAARSSVR